MRLIFVILSFGLVILHSCSQETSTTENKDIVPTEFSFENELIVLGTPEAVFDTLTGNIKPWWDHTFSEYPHKLYIEPFPGGGFYEYFDKNNNGVRHAVVTASHRGKLLRMEGPLGLAGHALNLVSTITLETIASDSTKIKLEVHGSGELKKEWPSAIEKVWKHFIEERLKPYLEGTLEK